MPPYCSVLDHTLMKKYLMHLKNPNAPTAKVLRVSILNYIIYFNKTIEIHNVFNFILAITPLEICFLASVRLNIVLICKVV